MHLRAHLLTVAAFSLVAWSGTSASESHSTQVSTEQLGKAVSDAASSADGDVAQQLAALELTERLVPSQLAKLLAELPGEKSRAALLLIADKAAFLTPPVREPAAEPNPDATTTRAMLVKVVNYVNNTNRQLPNLMAERTTTGFEDRPKEDALEATGIVSYSYQPLHWVGRSTVTVTYRDRNEVVDAKVKEKKEGAGIGGLVTSGEFGPILSIVVADALKGKISWARWEREDGATVGVFHYEVPDEKSNYRVQFCCVIGGYGGDGTPQLEKFDERAGYHGEIAFNPADGSVVRLTATVAMPAGGLVPHAGFAIEYSPVEIGGHSYICPAHAVATLQAHTTKQPAAFSKSAYRGDPKTFLNDIAFSNYRRFGSEMRMLPVARQ
jgi:hypothetical protein